MEIFGSFDYWVVKMFWNSTLLGINIFVNRFFGVKAFLSKNKLEDQKTFWGQNVSNVHFFSHKFCVSKKVIYNDSDTYNSPFRFFVIFGGWWWSPNFFLLIWILLVLLLRSPCKTSEILEKSDYRKRKVKKTLAHANCTE